MIVRRLDDAISELRGGRANGDDCLAKLVNTFGWKASHTGASGANQVGYEFGACTIRSRHEGAATRRAPNQQGEHEQEQPMRAMQFHPGDLTCFR